MKFLALLAIIVAVASAFTNHAACNNKINSQTKLEATRGDFLKWTAGATAAALFTPFPAQAVAKGPIYQACMSKCIYDCTKPKGDGQKSRSQCIPECRKQCDETKASLESGDPVTPDQGI